VETSRERSNEPSGSVKCWELPSGCTNCGVASGTEHHRPSYQPKSSYSVSTGQFLRYANRVATGLSSKTQRTALPCPTTAPLPSRDKSSYSRSEFVPYAVMHVCWPV
jgi:hypothetical protein